MGLLSGKKSAKSTMGRQGSLAPKTMGDIESRGPLIVKPTPTIAGPGGSYGAVQAPPAAQKARMVVHKVEEALSCIHKWTSTHVHIVQTALITALLCFGGRFQLTMLLVSRAATLLRADRSHHAHRTDGALRALLALSAPAAPAAPLATVQVQTARTAAWPTILDGLKSMASSYKAARVEIDAHGGDIVKAKEALEAFAKKIKAMQGRSRHVTSRYVTWRS